MVCKYCNKLCKNKNSLAQHEIRCKLNPNRKDYNNLSNYILNNRKGKNKDNCQDIAKQVNTLKNRYNSGHRRSDKDTKRIIEYVYQEHNNCEIKKWLEYVDSLSITIPEYQINNSKNFYPIIKGRQQKSNSTVRVLFEHDFIANLYLQNTLEDKNTVHHIDKNILNNDIHNLLIFETSTDHKRFHNSTYAYLIYDEISHKFRCEIRKI